MNKFSVLRAVLLAGGIALAGSTYAADAKPAVPQNAPKGSTDIKGDMIKACADTYVKAKVLSNNEASKFCRCKVTADGNMKVSDIWEIQSAANAGKNPITHPAIAKAQSELMACVGPDLQKVLEDKERALRAKQQQAAPTPAPAPAAGK